MSFILGGKTAKELGIKLLHDTQEPILPNIRSTSVSIPGRAGSYSFGSDLDSKLIELSCSVVGSTPYEVQKRGRDLAIHLLDGFGRPRTLDFAFDYDPDKIYQVKVANNIPIERLANMGLFTLMLIAHDPFAYLNETAQEHTLDDIVTLDTDVLPEQEYIFDITAPTIVSVNNYGTMNNFPITKISGSFATLKLSVNGKAFSYVEALSNNTLLIDHDRMTAKVDTFNKLKHVRGDFIYLAPGINQVEIDGTGLNCTVEFIFKPKFI